MKEESKNQLNDQIFQLDRSENNQYKFVMLKMNDIIELEHTFNEINRAFENQEISKEEYKNLLAGLDVERIVTMNAEELQRKEELNKIINAAINVVSAIA